MLFIDSHSTASFVQKEGGGKAWHLWQLEAAGLPVPPWVGIEASVFTEFLQISGCKDHLESLANQGMAGGKVEKQIETLLLSTPFPPSILEFVRNARAKIDAKRISVRSSGRDEDSAQHSFAGQFSTYLNVESEAEMLDSIRQCWASAFSDRSLYYRQQAGLPLQLDSLCVILQAMVSSKASGVLFTCDPVKRTAEHYLLHAVPGLGENYVSGALDPDIWELNALTGEVLLQEKAPRDTHANLDASQVRTLWELARRVDAIYHRPMDIEWAMDGAGNISLLQARPVTTPIVSGTARLHIWDNSNIVESYGGLTLPLTFHFAHYMYHNVYVQFCEVLGVSAKNIRAMDPWLRNMVGIFQGRVYYNLLNWYKLTSILPGYKHNRAFMETMMGTSRSLESEIADRIKPPSFHQSLQGRWNRFVTGLRFVSYHFRIQKVVHDFQKYFYNHYDSWNLMEFRNMPAEEILQQYHELEKVMLWNWKAPIINDYLCMVHFGIFRKLAAKWLAHLGDTFPNDLLAGEGNLESAEPTRELIRMAAYVRDRPILESLLMNTAPDSALEALRQSPFDDFYIQVQNYLREYGFRCMSEMKMEQKDLHQNPAPFFVFLTNLLRNNRTDLATYEIRERDIRLNAEQKMRKDLSGWRKVVFCWSLRNTRKAVRNRENTRFCRTRVYGIVRRMFWNMGADFASRGILRQEADVFYLTLDELKGALEGTNTVQNLQSLVELRRGEYQSYADQEPDSRFITRGPVYWNNAFHQEKKSSTEMELEASGDLQGKGCSVGVVEGVVKVILDPSDDMKLEGEILVTLRTDPGWIPLYPSVSGLLVERGGLLSHSAIVAREMGLPTIVGIQGLTQRLRSGMRIRMDGEKGTVTILDNAAS